jgi:hypothetical protein
MDMSTDRIVFRRKYYVTDVAVITEVSLRETSQLQPSVQANLRHLFLDCRKAFLQGKFPLTDSEMIFFAAHLFFHDHGPFDPLVHTSGFFQPELYLPSCFEMSLNLAEELVFEKHRTLPQTDRVQVMARFVKLCMVLPTYGAHIRRAVEAGTTSVMVVGVTAENLILLHPQTRRVVSRFQLDEIRQWGYSGDLLQVLIGKRSCTMREFKMDSEHDARLVTELLELRFLIFLF